jgi:23S rRNA (adenine1618-N6)-methyltransferase
MSIPFYNAGHLIDRYAGQDASRGITALPKHLLPFPSHYSFDLSGKQDGSLKQAITNINMEFSSLRQFCYSWNSKQSCIGYAREDVWSRKARRKFAREQAKGQGQQSDTMQCSDDGGNKQTEEIIENAALGFRIDLSLQADASVSVVVRWLKGIDQVLFESFCGMIKRKVMEETQA